jgi:predicted ATP-grasp superfamily ATP-dependent carboligase
MNVLVLSATASAINYARALAGRRDVRLFLSDASKFASGLYLQGVHPLLAPRARNLDQYRDFLDRTIADNRIDVLIPTSDHDVEGTMELIHQGWNPPVKMFRPNYETYRLLTHKADLNAAMHRHGLPAPRTYASVEEVEYPAVVKPAREGGSKGVWIVANREELDDRLDVVRKSFPGDVLMQQFIPGETGSIYVALLLYGADSKLYGEAASHSHATFMTWGGGGMAGVVVHEPELLQLAQRIVEAMGGWRGPINVEFKRHAETGQFYLLEVNCRLNGYSYLTTMNDMNFPSAVIDLLTVGTTPFVRMEPGRTPTNFVLGYREQPVEAWAGDASR